LSLYKDVDEFLNLYQVYDDFFCLNFFVGKCCTEICSCIN